MCLKILPKSLFFQWNQSKIYMGNNCKNLILLPLLFFLFPIYSRRNYFLWKTSTLSVSSEQRKYRTDSRVSAINWLCGIQQLHWTYKKLKINFSCYDMTLFRFTAVYFNRSFRQTQISTIVTFDFLENLRHFYEDSNLDV